MASKNSHLFRILAAAFSVALAASAVAGCKGRQDQPQQPGGQGTDTRQEGTGTQQEGMPPGTQPGTEGGGTGTTGTGTGGQ